MSDYEEAGQTIGCDPLLVQALGMLEGRGQGFDHFGRPMILFEPTKFAIWALRPNSFRASHPSVTHKRLPPLSPYGPDSLQWRHLQEAYQLDPHAALEATSWGRFQQLGRYSVQIGCGRVEQMVQAMCESEQAQLGIFVNHNVNSGMKQVMADKNWSQIAIKYNGSGTQGYDSKLQAAYERLKQHAAT